MISRRIRVVLLMMILVCVLRGVGLPEHSLLALEASPSLRHSLLTEDHPSTAWLGCKPIGLLSDSSLIEPYVRPALAQRMIDLRPLILAAAARHNQPDVSGMDNAAFAEVIALVLYNEHNGWFEDEIEPLRVFTPFYQQIQVSANQSGIGSNFSIWPTNLRPSVALEILQQQVPLPAPTQMITVPLSVHGSHIVLTDYASQEAIYAAISAELSQDELGIEYLAANLERGLYRAQFEDVPVSWHTLAAWHNQGIVRLDQVRANPTACDYVQRTAAYLPLAHRLIHLPAVDRVAEGKGEHRD